MGYVGVWLGLVGVCNFPPLATPAHIPNPAPLPDVQSPTLPRCRGLVAFCRGLVGLNMQHSPTLTPLAISLHTAPQWRGVPPLPYVYALFGLRVVASRQAKKADSKRTNSPKMSAVAWRVRYCIVVWSVYGCVNGCVWLRMVALPKLFNIMGRQL